MHTKRGWASSAQCPRSEAVDGLHEKVTPVAREFRQDYGAICCSHVFSEQRDVLLVVRNTDGGWQFLCGDEDSDCRAHHVGVGHLLTRDATLREMALLEPGSGAERPDARSSWTHFVLEDEEG